MAEVIVTKDNFEAEVINSYIPVLVDFWATWCGPCRMMGPILEKMAEEFDGKYKIAKVNVDEETELSLRYKIMSIPALKVFKNGENTASTVGVTSREELLEMLEK